MIDVKLELVGDKVAAVYFRGLGATTLATLEVAMGRIALALARESVQNKLMGQVLKIRTRTLARSVTQSPRVFVAGQSVIGTVGIANITGPGGRAPLKYGVAHEYGYSGEVTVKQHLRLLRENSKFKLVKTARSQDFGVYRKVKGKLTGEVATVRAHTRKMNIPERSFLRSALEDLQRRGVPLAEIEKAIAQALK